MKNLFRFPLTLLILFSFSTIIRADEPKDYEFLIITPAKYQRIAQEFIKLHDGSGAGGILMGKPWRIRGAYVLLENIYGRYDQEPSGVIEPSPAANPGTVSGVVTPGLNQIGKAYANNMVGYVIKFLRGMFKWDHDPTSDATPEYLYAFNILRDSNGVMNGYDRNSWIIHPEEAKFKYLLILGDTGAAGPRNVTFNGVPESWYVWMNEGVYNQDPDADGTIFPTDFFYAAPNYGNLSGNRINWVPSLRVGRLPVHDRDAALDGGPSSDSNDVTEMNPVDVSDTRINHFGIPSGGIRECDVCDSWISWGSTHKWAGDSTDSYELYIVSNTNGNNTSAVGATYLIVDNNDTCLRVVGTPNLDGIEIEIPPTAIAPRIPGDIWEIRKTTDEAQEIYNKCEAYVTAVVAPGAWNNWFRKVVTAGGDSSPTLFAFWDEFVLAQITNEDFLEGNEIIKLRHTNKDDGVAGNDFNATSLAPYFQDAGAGTDCGLLFHLGYGGAIGLILDGSFIDVNNVLGYTSSDSHIPIMVSNSDWNSAFDALESLSGDTFYISSYNPPDGRPAPSFGEAAVESIGGVATGGAIAYIGSTDIAYQGIIPYFNHGVLEQDRLYNMDELLSYSIESFHSSPRFLGDLFAGSPASASRGEGPINEFLASNLDIEGAETGLIFWASQKTVWEYTLLGDPVLPIPHPNIGGDPIETGTVKPNLAIGSLRSQPPQYESHNIGVDEIPAGGSASTTVTIAPVDSPSTVLEVKKTKIDIRRDTAVGGYYAPAAPALYTFTTANDKPGYYLVKVEQHGIDPITGLWGSWWEKERWIYVQEVNQFTPTTNNILVVDDDFGYPIVTWYYVPKDFTFYPSYLTRGYEDWYLKALDNVVGPGNYDVWHVDFDDYPPAKYPGGDDDWSGTDAGDALMHGEVYQGLLNTYAKVIWLTGDSSGYWRPSSYPIPFYWSIYDDNYPSQFTPSLKSTWLIETLTIPEQAYLEDYLNHSGRLFLSGQGILEDLGCMGIREEDAIVEGGNNTWCERRSDSLGIQNTFLTNYLHITDLHSSYWFGYLTLINRIAGNPIIQGELTVDIAGPSGAENQFFFVDAEPNLDTPIVSRIFQYDLSSGSGSIPHIGNPAYPFIGTAGLAYYQGRDASVFLPWGFESIDLQSTRNQVMAGVLSWLNSPTITGPGGPGAVCGNGICEPGENATSCPSDCGGGGPGGGGGEGGSLGCFIATACYGTPMAKEVRVLSNFRDKYLMTNSLGRFFVRNYYKFSPYLAEYISHRPLLKKFTRIGLKPLVRFSEKLVLEENKD